MAFLAHLCLYPPFSFWMETLSDLLPEHDRVASDRGNAGAVGRYRSRVLSIGHDPVLLDSRSRVLETGSYFARYLRSDVIGTRTSGLILLRSFVPAFLVACSISIPLFGSSFPVASDQVATGADSFSAASPPEFHGAGFQGTTAAISSITPSLAFRGQSVISGSNLSGTTTVNRLGSGLTVNNLASIDTTVTATSAISLSAAVGTSSVSLGTPNGSANKVKPIVTGISPASASPGQTINVTFTGSGLATTNAVSGWGSNVTVSNLQATDTAVTATFTLNNSVTIGTYSLSLATAHGNSNKVAFDVTAGSVPTLSVSSASLDFGNSPDNTAKTLPLTLSSTGTAAVTVSAGSISGTGFSMSGATFPVTLNPGVSITMQVQFDPPSASTDTGSITFSSNSSTGSTTGVSLSGTGIHWVSLSWTAPTNSPVPVAGYNVYRASSVNSNFQLLNSSMITPTSYSDSTVQSGSTYTYYVESVDSSGGTSVASANISVSIP